MEEPAITWQHQLRLWVSIVTRLVSPLGERCWVKDHFVLSHTLSVAKQMTHQIVLYASDVLDGCERALPRVGLASQPTLFRLENTRRTTANFQIKPSHYFASCRSHEAANHDTGFLRSCLNLAGTVSNMFANSRQG